MAKRVVEYMTKTTPDVAADQMARLREIFPECVAEGRVDFERLRATLGDLDALAGEETYSFTWAGRADAFRAVQTPSAASLRPAPGESVNWDTTQHLFIEGENLEVLKLLYKSYYGRVKMIYIDPPYNTGSDFIYRDDYSQPRRAYLEKTGQADAEGNVLTSNPEASGRFHSDWLTMMYPRLFLARQLLREDGVIFVSIDDHEVHNLRFLMNEIFGEENFLASLCWERADSPKMDADYFSTKHDYVLCYGRAVENFHIQRLLYEGDSIPDHYDRTDEHGRAYYLKPLRAMGGQGETREARPNLYYGIKAPDGSEVFPKLQSGEDGAWRWSKRKLEAERERIDWANTANGWVPYFRIYADESPGRPPETILYHQDVGSTRTATAEIKKVFQQGKVFDTPKPIALIRHFLLISTNTSDIILDFFAGSATSAHAVLQLNREDDGNRQFVCIQMPEPVAEDTSAHNAGFETVAEVGKERIRRVIAQMQTEREGQLPLDTRDTPEDLGFRVFKLAPSTFRQWEQPDDADELVQQLTFFDRGLEEGADPQHVLYEVILKEGYPLTSRIETLPLDANRIYRVTDTRQEEDSPRFYLCLDAQVHTSTLDALPLDKEMVLICLDSALDDSQKVNLAKQCLLKVL